MRKKNVRHTDRQTDGRTDRHTEEEEGIGRGGGCQLAEEQSRPCSRRRPAYLWLRRRPRQCTTLCHYNTQPLLTRALFALVNNPLERGRPRRQCRLARNHPNARARAPRHSPWAEGMIAVVGWWTGCRMQNADSARHRYLLAWCTTQTERPRRRKTPVEKSFAERGGATTKKGSHRRKCTPPHHPGSWLRPSSLSPLSVLFLSRTSLA